MCSAFFCSTCDRLGCLFGQPQDRGKGPRGKPCPHTPRLLRCLYNVSGDGRLVCLGAPLTGLDMYLRFVATRVLKAMWRTGRAMREKRELVFLLLY